MIGKFFKWFFLVFAALIAIGIALTMYAPEKTPEQKAADQAKREQRAAADAQSKADQARQEAASMPEVTSVAYAKAYDENTVAADQQFKGKKFKVSGTVSDINTDIMGNPVLVLRGLNEFQRPQFSFSKSALDDLAKIKKGNKVTLVCTGKGDVIKTPMASDCSLL